MVNLLGLLVIALFAYSGYRRGLVRMAASLLALLVAGLLAQPLAPLGALPLGSSVPLLLKPLAGAVVMALILFVVFDLLIGIPLRKRTRAREDEGLPRMAPWERPMGLVLGAFWGLGILTLCLAGINAAGHAQRAMRQSDAQIAYREKHPGRWTVVPVTELHLAEPERAEVMSTSIDESVFAPLVVKVNPIDDKVEKTLEDLRVVVNDPQLMALFMANERVRTLMENQTLQGLAKDPEIAASLRAGDYRGLMDNPKLAAVTEDRVLMWRLRELHIDGLLEEVRQSSQSLPGEKT